MEFAEEEEVEQHEHAEVLGHLLGKHSGEYGDIHLQDLTHVMG